MIHPVTIISFKEFSSISLILILCDRTHIKNTVNEYIITCGRVMLTERSINLTVSRFINKSFSERYITNIPLVISAEKIIIYNTKLLVLMDLKYSKSFSKSIVSLQSYLFSSIVI